MSGNELAPVIIKRKKVIGGGGHHGGAWKVAYADFVTAMMAFFMLMWLLNATTETQRKGLADYFSPTIAVARISGGGNGAFGGDSLFIDSTMAQSGRGGVGQQDKSGATESETDGTKEEMAAETEALEEVQAGLLGNGGESMLRDDVFRHVSTRLTDEGLVIEIFALEGRPLFEPGTSTPTSITEALSEALVEVIGLVKNKVSIANHVATYPVVVKDNPAWPLTSARSQAMLELLTRQGFPPDRALRLTGFGQQKPTLADRMDVRNNRIVVTLLREYK